MPEAWFVGLEPPWVGQSWRATDTLVPLAPSARESSLQAGRPPEEPGTPSPTLPTQFKQRAPMYNCGLGPAAPAPAAPTSPLTPSTPPATAPAAQTPPVAMVAPQTQPPAQPQPKKNLSLTVGTLGPPACACRACWVSAGRPGTHTLSLPSSQREQMFAAQEMFKTANKVTRPEKALILGFMAGSRGSACGGGQGLGRGQGPWPHAWPNFPCPCREPVPGAGRCDPDQAQRAHRRPAQG